jgi:hypothetical protein
MKILASIRIIISKEQQRILTIFSMQALLSLRLIFIDNDNHTYDISAV